MKKLTLNLPDVRLILRLLRRRIVTIFENKNIKKILGSNLAFILLASSIIPTQARALHLSEPKEEVVISVSEKLSDSIKTEIKIHYPLEKVIVNQRYNLFHPGLDLEGVTGQTVYPMEEGVVVASGWDRTGYGNRVIIAHSNTETLYAHLSKVVVKVGDKVEPFTKIGEVGTTGHSTGSHLHFEVRKNGIPINPFGVLPKIN